MGLRRWVKAALLLSVAGFILARRRTPYERVLRSRQSSAVEWRDDEREHPNFYAASPGGEGNL